MVDIVRTIEKSTKTGDIHSIQVDVKPEKEMIQTIIYSLTKGKTGIDLYRNLIFPDIRDKNVFLLPDLVLWSKQVKTIVTIKLVDRVPGRKTAMRCTNGRAFGTPT